MKPYSPGIFLIWNIASVEAKLANAKQIRPPHFLIALCKFNDLDFKTFFAGQQLENPDLPTTLESEKTRISKIFQELNFDTTKFRRQLRRQIAKPGLNHIGAEELHRNSVARQAFRSAELIAASDADANQVFPDHLLKAMLKLPDQPWEIILKNMGIQNPYLGAIEVSLIPKDNRVQKKQHSPTPFLDRFGRDLNRLAHEGKLNPLIGRKEELRALAQGLIQQRKKNVLLVGEAGVGKTCIVEGLAQLLESDSPPSVLKGKRIIEISIADLLAGTMYRGQFEERIQGVIQEALHNKEMIIFIDEFHTVMGAGGEGANDAANILKPELARGNLQCIGATTMAEYRKYIEEDSALNRRFQVIYIDEPNREEATRILQGLKPGFESHYGLKITDEAINAAVEFSQRYLSELRLPDKAIDLIDQACAGVRLSSISSWKNKPTTTEVKRIDVASVVSRKCRIPLERLSEDEKQRLLHLEEYLCQRVIGQEDAVSRLAESIRIARTGLKPANKPVGVFLFAGATGTGKTELAKALANLEFDDNFNSDGYVRVSGKTFWFSPNRCTTWLYRSR